MSNVISSISVNQLFHHFHLLPHSAVAFASLRSDCEYKSGMAGCTTNGLAENRENSGKDGSFFLVKSIRVWEKGERCFGVILVRRN